MKKGIIAVSALCAAAAVSIGGFLVVRSNSRENDRKEKEQLKDKVLFKLDSDDITKIEISNGDGTYIAEFDGYEWVMTESTDTVFDVNQTTFQSITTNLSELTASSSYGELTDESRAKYGLDSPYTLTFYDGDGAHTLYIGDISPTGDLYYVSTDSKNGVYTISKSTADNLIKDRPSLKDDRFVPYGDNDIVGFKLIKNGKTVYEITRDLSNGLWNLPEKYSALTVNQSVVEKMTTMSTRLTAEFMYPESSEAFTAFGFDKPYAEFIISGTDGSERSILMSKFGPDADTYTHTYMKNSDQVEMYYASDLGFIDYTIYDLIVQQAEYVNYFSITGFEIESDVLSDSFTINDDSTIAECRGTEFDLTNSELQNYFQTFYYSFALFALNGIDLDAQPDIGDSTFSATYHLKAGGDMKIDLVPTSVDNQYYVMLDGKYTGTTAYRDFTSGTDSMLSVYKTLCRQAGIEPNVIEYQGHPMMTAEDEAQPEE